MQWKLPKFLSTAEWLERQQTSILSAAAIITVANIISSLSGLLRQRLLIGSFFQSPTSQQAYEALLVAFQVPDLMFQLIIIGAISAAFIPIFTSLRKTNDEEAFTMSSVVMNILLVVFTVVAVVVFIFAEQITDWRTGDAFTREQIVIASNLTRIMLVAQMFFAISNFLSGMLQSYQRFVIPSIAPIFYNLGILLGVYLFEPYLGIYSAGVGVIMGAFVHMAIQLPLAFKLGFRFKLSLNWRQAGVKDLFKLMPPRVFTQAIAEVQDIALGFFATSIGNLSFVIIRLGMTLMTIPIRLFGVPISQASLPFLSEESDEKELNRFRSLVVDSLHQISFLAMPASILLLILRVPIVRLVFGTQNFPWATTVSTARVVAIIAVSIAAQGMTQLLTRAFYAIKDTKTPLYITLATQLLFVVICGVSVFLTPWAIYGIAFAVTLSALLEFGLLILLLNRKVHGFLDKSFWVPQLKMIITSFLMAVFLYLPFRILDEVVFNTSRTLELIALTVVTGTIGMLVYIYFAMLLEIRELQLFLRLVNSFGRWRRPLSETKESFMETSIEDGEI